MNESSLVRPQHVLALLTSIVDRPSVALADIMAQPRGRWVLPMLLAALATALSAIVTAPYLAVEAKAQMATVLNSLPADQVAMLPEQITAVQTPTFLAATTAAVGVLGLLIGWVVGRPCSTSPP